MGMLKILIIYFVNYSPHHFKRVKISAIALVKMVMHTRRGGDLEVMGLMQGKVKGGKLHLDISPYPDQTLQVRIFHCIVLSFKHDFETFYRHLLCDGLLRPTS